MTLSSRLIPIAAAGALALAPAMPAAAGGVFDQSALVLAGDRHWHRHHHHHHGWGWGPPGRWDRPWSPPGYYYGPPRVYYPPPRLYYAPPPPPRYYYAPPPSVGLYFRF